MSNLEILNSFLQRSDLSAAEFFIKEQLIEFDKLIKSNNDEREKLSATLKEKEVDFLKLSGAFDSHLKLILSLSKVTQGLENSASMSAE